MIIEEALKKEIEEIFKKAGVNLGSEYSKSSCVVEAIVAAALHIVKNAEVIVTPDHSPGKLK